MAFKPIESAQARWRAVNAPHLVALVRAGYEPGNNLAFHTGDRTVVDRLTAQASNNGRNPLIAD